MWMSSLLVVTGLFFLFNRQLHPGTKQLIPLLWFYLVKSTAVEECQLSKANRSIDLIEVNTQLISSGGQLLSKFKHFFIVLRFLRYGICMVKAPGKIQPIKVFIEEIASGMNTSVLIDYADFCLTAESVDLIITDARGFSKWLLFNPALCFISNYQLVRKRCLISICE